MRTQQSNTKHAYILPLLALLLCCGTAQAQSVIMSGNNFLTHNEAGNVVNTTATTSFDPSTCLWYINDNRIRPANNEGTQINRTNNYLQTGNGAVSFGGNGNAQWQTANNGSELVARQEGWWNPTYYYLRLNSNAWEISTGNNRATAYTVTRTHHNFEDNTINPTISISSLGGSTVTFNRTDLGGTYTREYTQYRFNSTNHYWYDNTDHNAAPATVQASSLNPTYTWSVVSGGGSFNGNVLTLPANPTTDIVVRLTVSNIAPLANKTVDFTLTRANVASTTVTVLATPAINPQHTGLYNNESQTFTASAVVSSNIIPAHITFTGGDGTVCYYYEGTLYNSTSDFYQPTTPPAVSYAWALSGEASSNLSLSTLSGSSTTVTHNPEVPADRTATLTVTASATGAADKIATATVNAYIPLVAPTITLTGSTVSMSTSNLGATIYYTTDGTTPTASSTPYTGTFELETSPVTVRAIAIRDEQSSAVATETFTLTLPTPIITINPSTGSATIACATSGTTIYYTTDGTDPTGPSASAQTYSDAFVVANGTTIKAYATKTGYTSSALASSTYAVTGVSGSVVTLNDLEDHEWTYYAGVDAQVDGGDYNTNYLGTLYCPNPRNLKITYQANGGAISRDELETTMVYYKTLEQGPTAGQYPYTVISNPFSKRPTGKGFSGWRIVSGGEYIADHNNNDVLALDEAITFSNLPYPAVNAISAEIVFEATWVNYNNLTRINTDRNNYTYNTTGGSYETNFLVLNRNVTGTITTNSPCTIMMVEPDGSTDHRNTYTFTGTIDPNNNGVTKIEFTKWNSTKTLNCNNHSVTVGRGMTTIDQCVSYVTGVTGKENNRNLATYTNLDYHLKLESGVFTDVSFIAGTINISGYVNCNGTNNQVRGTLGNDYDRAKNDNTKLTITDELALGARPTYANGNQNNAVFKCWVKSGNLGSGINVVNTTFNAAGNPNGGYYGLANQTFYVSCGNNQTYIGKRMLYVEGGILAGIAGGIDEYNNANDETFFLRMTGGRVRGVVYGAAAFAETSGHRRMIITGGTINGWIAAGCNGTDYGTSGGILPSNTYVYIGGDAQVGNATDLQLNTSNDGNVFGAGSGNASQPQTGRVENSNVVIADQSYVKRNVYGGGNYGFSNAMATIYVTGGQVGGSVFGGSNQKTGVDVNINMTDGQVDGGIYGGSNMLGIVSGDVVMTVNGGQVGTLEAKGNIHGGGYGQQTQVTGNVDITLGTCGAAEGVTVWGDVYGGSALGSVNGNVANATNAAKHTYVTLNKGIINGSVYGGALGSPEVAANVYGAVAVKVLGGSVRTTTENGSGAVYGCNNINGAPQSTVTVDIYNTDPAPGIGTYALDAVYGGGNKAAYNNTPEVTIHGCSSSINYVYGGGNATDVRGTNVIIWGGTIGNAFGGGNGYSTNGNHNDPTSATYNPGANITANGTNLTIHGGTIGKAFGGSNQYGTITGGINITVDATAETGNDACGNAYSLCPINIGELYGGGNEANSSVGNITIGCMGADDMIDYVYGGANQANIDGNVNLNITGGRIGNLFGGNNQSGAISGTINVLVDWSLGGCSNNYLGNVYGGGNMAAYGHSTNHPVVKVLQATVSGSVYGGGLGGSATVTGNPQVTVGDANNAKAVEVLGNVFGGGNAAPISGNTHVTVVGNTHVHQNVYGGGNAASVSGSTQVLIGD